VSELNQGLPSVAENAIPVPTVDTAAPVEAPQQEAVSQAPQVTIPAKYAGKGPEELARMLEDQERHIGRQANELGELRQRSTQYEQWLAQVQMQQAQQAQTALHQQPQVSDEPSKFNWEDPDRSVDSRVDRRVKAEMDGLRRQVMMETAASQAPIAKNIAKSMYPDAFKGIGDDELDRAMYGGAAAGNVQPQNLTKPEAWRMLAWILQGEKQGYKMGSSVSPVSPTSSETPMGAKPQSFGETQTQLDDQARSILRGFNDDEGEYLKRRRDESRGR